MKTIFAALALLAAAPLAASADVSKEDIKKLAAAGVGDEVILSFIRSNGPVSRFTADDLVELKQAGASEKVLSALAAGVSRPSPAPAPAATEQQVYTAPQTVVYQQPYYASSYYPSYSYASYGGYYGYPYYYGGYYGSCYPRYGYSGYCGPRVSVGVGFSSGWGWGGANCGTRATWSMSHRR